MNDVAQVYMTETELARDLPAAPEKVRQGIETIVAPKVQPPILALEAGSPGISRRK